MPTRRGQGEGGRRGTPIVHIPPIEDAGGHPLTVAGGPVHVDGEEVLPLVELPGREGGVQRLLQPLCGVGDGLHGGGRCSRTPLSQYTL